MNTKNKSTKNLKFIKSDELDQKLNEIEHRDFYHLIDDIEVSASCFRSIISQTTLPPGVRTHTHCEGLTYTPYFYYETEEQKNNYKEFVETAKKLICL